jgi:hypothetical protein
MATLAAAPALAGTLYADTNTALYTVNETSGTLTTVATGFTQARGIAFDNSGDVFVADFGSGNVNKVAGGTVTNFITGLSGPYGLIFTPSGNLVVSTNNGLVSTYDTSGNLVGSSINVGGNLTDLAYNPTNSHLLVSSRSAGTVIDVTNGNTVLTTLGSTSGFTDATRGVTTVNGVMYVDESTGVNGTTGTIFEVDPATGAITSSLFTDAANGPKGNAYDPDTGLIYYAAAGGLNALGAGLYSFDPLNPGASPNPLSSLEGPIQFQDVAVDLPEPASMALLGTAFAVLVHTRRSRR